MPKDQAMPELPDWVPMSVARYVAHTERGVPIRALARRDGCHASTVLRQIRKLETMREDPLVDAALIRLQEDHKRGMDSPLLDTEDADAPPDEMVLRREGLRVLRALCEAGAVLAVAGDMENAVVVGEAGARKAVVRRQIAQAMALNDWIGVTQSGRISRYVITPAGRTVLREMLAEAENTARGCAESQAEFAGDGARFERGSLHHAARARKVRFNLIESPVAALARRRDKDGARFLSQELVAAGERLREDFELAQMATRLSQNWEREGSGSEAGRGAEAAQQRVAAALRDLGDGLSDIALRCCCYLEGLETAEKRLGWSARSGKIVLRIALMRLRDYYRANAGGAGDYIG